ncbi:MAG: peptidase M48, partial [Armatimonadetes bacterium]|nr:peptidase M48 [Armatimonadota bacterium]
MTATCAAVLAMGATGCRNTNFISTKDEVRIGRDASAEIGRRYRVQTDTPDARRVAEIGARVLEHSDRRAGVPYTFQVIDLKDVNAVSLPGGPVSVS